MFTSIFGLKLNQFGLKSSKPSTRKPVFPAFSTRKSYDTIARSFVPTKFAPLNWDFYTN